MWSDFHKSMSTLFFVRIYAIPLTFVTFKKSMIYYDFQVFQVLSAH